MLECFYKLRGDNIYDLFFFLGTGVPSRLEEPAANVNITTPLIEVPYSEIWHPVSVQYTTGGAAGSRYICRVDFTMNLKATDDTSNV